MNRGFNSCPREGGDNMGMLAKEILNVSIHAPRRGRPGAQLHGYVPDDCFNSRPREGGDPAPDSAVPSCWVSIHAPAKGATLLFTDPVVPVPFQFTPPRRGRHMWGHGEEIIPLFQFTPPRRGRLLRWAHSLRWCEFQFTPPRRGRPSVSILRSRINVSIHAPAKGATTKYYK